MNANRIVSNQQLMRSAPEGFDVSDLSKRIYILRDKLGVENEWRIRAVRGIGYMYVTPEQSSGKTQPCNTDRFPISPGGRFVPPNDAVASQSGRCLLKQKASSPENDH
jgi:DNA-binding winged helix-turn-helix (wHTH) protein